MNTENLTSALRSLFRFQLMKDNHYPSIIVDTESMIMSERMKKLSKKEIDFINNNFKMLYKEYLVDLEVQDIAFQTLLDKELNKIN